MEKVSWRDAFFFKDAPEADPDDYVVITLGWVTEGPRFLRIASEQLPGEDGDRCVTFVPIENVVERQQLTAVRRGTMGEWIKE
jgi:hypothetical protein